MAYSKNVRKFLLIALLTGWTATLAYFKITAAKEIKLYRDNRVLMGTFFEVTSVDKRAAEIVFNEVQRLEGLLSKYQETSEISILNRTGKLKVSPETFYILKKSKEFWQVTNGAFDITVAPLVKLWGFTPLELPRRGAPLLTGPIRQSVEAPNDRQIKSALGLVGSDKIILQENNSVVEFKLPGVNLDLGAIAKGYALDCAAKKLKEKNIKNCLINAGGQVYALGSRLNKPWRVAIKNPREGGVGEILELTNQSASTSGDYEQFFLKNGKRYCHIINPKTGYPADSGISSVTVIADQGLTADALSTAIFVAGKDKAAALVKQFNNLKTIIKE